MCSRSASFAFVPYQLRCCLTLSVRYRDNRFSVDMPLLAHISVVICGTSAGSAYFKTKLRRSRIIDPNSFANFASTTCGSNSMPYGSPPTMYRHVIDFMDSATALPPNQVFSGERIFKVALRTKLNPNKRAARIEDT